MMILSPNVQPNLLDVSPEMPQGEQTTSLKRNHTALHLSSLIIALLDIESRPFQYTRRHCHREAFVLKSRVTYPNSAMPMGGWAMRIPHVATPKHMQAL